MRRSLACALVGAVTALAMGQNDAYAQDPLEPELGVTTNLERDWGLEPILPGRQQFRYTRTDGEGAEEVDTEVSAIGTQIGFSFGIF